MTYGAIPARCGALFVEGWSVAVGRGFLANSAASDAASCAALSARRVRRAFSAACSVVRGVEGSTSMAFVFGSCLSLSEPEPEPDSSVDWAEELGFVVDELAFLAFSSREEALSW